MHHICLFHVIAREGRWACWEQPRDAGRGQRSGYTLSAAACKMLGGTRGPHPHHPTSLHRQNQSTTPAADGTPPWPGPIPYGVIGGSRGPGRIHGPRDRRFSSTPAVALPNPGGLRTFPLGASLLELRGKRLTIYERSKGYEAKTISQPLFLEAGNDSTSLTYR